MKPLTREQIRDIDRRATSELGIPSLQLMENAGTAVADLATKLLSSNNLERIAFVCGTGNNGGDGFVAARHLASRNLDLKVFLLGRHEQLSPDAAAQFEKLRNLPVLVESISSIEPLIRFAAAGPLLWVDCIFGTGLNRPVEGLAQYAIEILNESAQPILAVDIPSGLNADTGEILGSVIHATQTITFVRPKISFEKTEVKKLTGEISVAFIGIPESAIQNWCG